MKKKLAYIGATGATLLAPLVAFAQSGVCTNVASAGTLEAIICTVYRIIRIAIPVLILGAVAWFIWGIVRFMTAKDGDAKAEARGTMVHGIIGFAVILGLWGLVYILLDTFGVGSGSVNVNDFPTF